MEPILFDSGIKNVIFGERVKIVQPVNIYGCTIMDNCFIGPFVEIQKDVVIGCNTKIQSHTFICELVSIGNECFIGHGVMFINDLFTKGGPAQGDKTMWKSTKIGNNVSIGSNATILPVEICDNVVIGAGAVVTKNIEKQGVYAGNPAKFIKNIIT
ncbi:MAG: N-acetyltransferase [Bacteroidia bacterium]|nr:N-acetyltransferase [Bacteroidia bacterium]